MAQILTSIALYEVLKTMGTVRKRHTESYGKLIRHKTLADGEGECNYWILGDKDPDARYQKLVSENRDIPKALKQHTGTNIFPAIGSMTLREYLQPYRNHK